MGDTKVAPDEQIVVEDNDEAADEEGQLDFLEMLGDNSSRKTAASTFFELLVLKCTGVINVDQQEAFGSIMVTKTVRSQSPRLTQV